MGAYLGLGCTNGARHRLHHCHHGGNPAKVFVAPPVTRQFLSKIQATFFGTTQTMTSSPNTLVNNRGGAPPAEKTLPVARRYGPPAIYSKRGNAKIRGALVVAS